LKRRLFGRVPAKRGMGHGKQPAERKGKQHLALAKEKVQLGSGLLYLGKHRRLTRIEKPSSAGVWDFGHPLTTSDFGRVLILGFFGKNLICYQVRGFQNTPSNFGIFRSFMNFCRFECIFSFQLFTMFCTKTRELATKFHQHQSTKRRCS